jgi:hypothetical protein
MTRPAEGPGTPQREMVILDRIRLIGLLKENPAFAGFSHSWTDRLCITGASRPSLVRPAISDGRDRNPFIHARAAPATIDVSFPQ